jgi:hypothetical protein
MFNDPAICPQCGQSYGQERVLEADGLKLHLRCISDVLPRMPGSLAAKFGDLLQDAIGDLPLGKGETRCEACHGSGRVDMATGVPWPVMSAQYSPESYPIRFGMVRAMPCKTCKGAGRLRRDVPLAKTG